MKQKKYFIIVAFVGLMFIVIGGYNYLLPSKPGDFFTNEQLIQKMNGLIEQDDIRQIQDIMALSERNYFVPFQTEDGSLGMSYWTWKNGKWIMNGIEMNQYIAFWQLDQKDPSTTYFLWNFPPDEQLKTLQLYLIKEREYVIGDGEHHYEPRVQMNEEVQINNNRFGIKQIPNDWSLILNKFEEDEMYVGWNIRNTKDEIYYDWFDMNSYSFWNDNDSFLFVQWLDELNIENPNGG